MIRASLQLQKPGVDGRGGFSLDVEFEERGRVLGVFGPSGAGKTTLINLIAGLESADRGTIVVGEATAERVLFDRARGIDVPVHRRRVGVVFQEHRLFPHYSVRGNLTYARRDSGGLSRIAELLELGPLLDRNVRELSGGEKQRVALGRALLSRPELLLLDEPLASLDVRLRDQIVPYLCRVRDEMRVPMVYVSHDLSEILRLTERVLFLEGGKSVGHGRYVDVVHDDAVLAVVHDRGMENVIAAQVIEHRVSDGVTVLRVGRGDAGQAPAMRSATLSAPLCAAAAGHAVLIAVKPWDVALAGGPVHGVSIQNQVRGVVKRVTEHERSVLVEVDIGAELIVEISRKAAASLGLRTGQDIVCLIKSHAIRYVG